MYGKEVAYVALVAANVEAAANMFEKDYGLKRSTKTFDGRAVHVVCVVDPGDNYGAVYTNGVRESELTASWPAFSSVSSAWAFIGRSLFSADGWLNGTIDELRIYDGRLTPGEIAGDFQLGPDELALPVTLVQSNLPSSFILSWPSWAVGFSLQSSTNLVGGIWTAVPQTPVLANDQQRIALLPTNQAIFFRLRR